MQAEGRLRVRVSAAGLAAGMRVAVVAPSGPVDPQRLAYGCGVLERFGLRVTVGRHVLDRDAVGYLAGTDGDRAADLEQAWCDPSVGAVLCARGGYGAVRVLDLLDWTAMRRVVDGGGVKPFVGCSDVTVLHHGFARHLGVATHFGPTVAGPLLGVSDPEPVTVAGLRQALFAPEVPLRVSGGEPMVGGSARGVTVGGTLSMVCSLAGTPEFGHAGGGIVLLEDVGESPYRIDRMLTHLLRAGWFDGVAGIACGSWQRCGPPGAVEAVLRERLSGLGVPLVTGLPFGHGPVQATVALGVSARLDADSGTLQGLNGGG
jgi:muramoyltetrapeptide carboxypeptidase